jgi:hypothetical protein
MKQLPILIFLSISLVLLPCVSSAQSEAKVEVGGAKQNGDVVEYTLSSDKAFYFADNTYILHIGLKEFNYYKEWKEDGKGKMMFLIPVNEYNKLMAGDEEWLTYGNKVHKETGEEVDVEAACKLLPMSCWWLGRFQKIETGK